uniref:Aspartate aminotransferase n=1 Tax=Paulinella micropora TaxID=1928728 RepID=A0A385I0S0_9EUKA|nr:aspartate aminotransferase [Paulinella micropora]AXY63474.1 aspartate aminotransferase [Paulinella micropora]
MISINSNYQKLKANYLFPAINERVRNFVDTQPKTDIIRLGIGDVTKPLPAACRSAMKAAIDEMGTVEGFHGYGPEQGYSWLRETIAYHDFQSRGCDISSDEIFISDGSKCDCSNMLDILSKNNSIAVTDPVYPVYIDSNVMAGHTGDISSEGYYEGLTYLPITADNNFIASLPKKKIDIIYLCFPNNPTGAIATKSHLEEWVNYALKHGSLILFDAAYEAFIQDPDLPHSIFDINGARQCAIEFRSFSKTAGFTGTRCAFSVIPKDITGINHEGNKVKIWDLWMRRQSTKFNGVSYIVQRGAEAIYSAEGQKEIKQLINFYMTNATIIYKELEKVGFNIYGGQHAPYVWVKNPVGQTSWDFFDHLLKQANVVGTPGSGFGKAGEGYLRLSAFNSRINVETAMNRITSMY